MEQEQEQAVKWISELLFIYFFVFEKDRARIEMSGPLTFEIFFKII